MYLPLVPLVCGLVAALLSGLSVWRAHAQSPQAVVSNWRWLVGLAVLSLVLGSLTFLRNRVYASELAMWSDVVAKQPENGRAHCGLAWALVSSGQPRLALDHYEAAVRIWHPLVEDPRVQQDWGCCLMELKRGAEAFPHFMNAVAGDSKWTDTHLNFANLLASLRYPAAAHRELAAALRLNPELITTAEDPHDPHLQRRRNMVAYVCRELGATPQQLLDATPDAAQVEYELGAGLYRAKEYEAALEHFNAANRQHPSSEMARELDVARSLVHKAMDIERPGAPSGVAVSPAAP